MVGSSLDTGIDKKAEFCGNGVTLDTTIITFTYPISLGLVVAVAYKSQRHPARVAYSSMKFFTIAHSLNQTEEQYTIHIVSEAVHYSLVQPNKLPTKTRLTQTYDMEYNLERLPYL